MAAKIAVVTGGSAGIGLATAEKLAQQGWSVAILARDEERLAQAAAFLRLTGAKILPLSVDVADAQAVDEAAARIEHELGPISVWVNNAMSTVIAPADKIRPDEYARVTATTYLGQVHGTLAALRHMKPRGAGTIIQISSILGFRGVPLQAPYCAAKFAVSGFTDSLRAELIADGVDIALTMIYLPAVNTPQFNWSRNRSGQRQLAPDPVYDPRICADAVVQAIADPTREIWVGPRTLALSAGQDLAPAYADQVASGFRDDQLGEPEAERDGNLYEPTPGPAAIDGPWTANVTSPRGQILTSRHRQMVEVGMATVVGSLAITGLVALCRGFSKA